MRDSLSALVAPSAQAIQFAMKTLLAGALALWCALRFGLEQPQWALMSVFIVSQPLSGMVVQKGLARLLGTLVGASMSVLMMALFAQAPWLFLIAVALWMGLCTAASTLLRSAWGYAFVLAGYTVAIVGLPAISEPLTIFDQAVARGTEIALGIICATVVSAVLWPQRVEWQLGQQARSAWQSGVNAAAQTLVGEPMARQGLLEVLGRMVAVDAQREHAWFEGPRGRLRAAALRLLSRDLLTLLRLARGVGRQWRQLSEAESHALAPWMQRVRDCLSEPQGPRCARLAQEMREVAEDERLSAAQRRCLDRLALLLLRLETAGNSLQAVEQGEARGSLPPALSWHRDWQTALLYGSRSALAFLALAAFWMGTGWTAASGAMLLASVVCSLFASRENAAQIGLLFLRGVFYAVPVAFFVGQILLPQLNGFAMLCLALGVPLFFGALGMAKPAMMATSTSFCLHFIVLCAPQNDMNYDLAFFFNEALAMLIGVGCAVLAFNLIGLRSPNWHGRRLLRATLQDLARLTQHRLIGAESWFGGRMADRLLQLARHYPLLPSQTRNRWDDGVASLDLGDELLHLRACLAAGDGSLGQAEADFLARLRQQLLLGPAAERESALDEAAEQLLQALRSAPSSIDRRLAEAALLQLQEGWRRWCGLQEGSDGLA
ncbi:Fusaric acid resistance protein conserved region [Pseudomonas sp. 8Z]|uniref:FUSC family protein n=1 Tax=Pseudomonas sp. 8Z TaxID=2653166 RepID=UPI0012F320CD|nr:FUSC family protein [Pseudomonas sp. 8Z]VXC52912.1 Fusaric acid resistance protein conserved region [Pseudomonas sp. 8Z]